MVRRAVTLSVLSHAGKEAVAALLEVGHFSARLPRGPVAAHGDCDGPCPVDNLAVEKSNMVRQLHAALAFADRFLTHMLTRNLRIQEDLVDQLFNSSEKRLARTLLLLAEPEI